MAVTRRSVCSLNKFGNGTCINSLEIVIKRHSKFEFPAVTWRTRTPARRCFVVKWCSLCSSRCPLGYWWSASRKSAARSRPAGSPVPTAADLVSRSWRRSPSRRCGGAREDAWFQTRGPRGSRGEASRHPIPAASCCRTAGSFLEKRRSCNVVNLGATEREIGDWPFHKKKTVVKVDT